MRHLTRSLALFAIIATATSCGDVVRSGRAPSYLIIDSIEGIRGFTTDQPAKSNLISDVITNVTTPLPCSQTAPCPTIFSDPGRASMHIALKDPAAPSTPSEVNAITITRYRVDYLRADGRNTPGVDVPYGFDGAVTFTVSSATSSSFGFMLVRNVAKEEAPLVQLKNSASIITVLAKLTFYGHDQAGNEVTATGSIQIDFGNFGDPA